MMETSPFLYRTCISNVQGLPGCNEEANIFYFNMYLRALSRVEKCSVRIKAEVFKRVCRILFFIKNMNRPTTAGIVFIPEVSSCYKLQRWLCYNQMEVICQDILCLYAQSRTRNLLTTATVDVIDRLVIRTFFS